MAQVINLQYAQHTFVKMNRGNRYEVYYDKKNNNLIVFTPYHKGETSIDIGNATVTIPYSYLMKRLNKDKNLIVHWSKVEGTTSDYTIFEGLNPEEYKSLGYRKLIALLDTLIVETGNNYVPYKYTLHKNKRLAKLEF